MTANTYNPEGPLGECLAPRIKADVVWWCQNVRLT